MVCLVRESLLLVRIVRSIVSEGGHKSRPDGSTPERVTSRRTKRRRRLSRRLVAYSRAKSQAVVKLQRGGALLSQTVAAGA